MTQHVYKAFQATFGKSTQGITSLEVIILANTTKDLVTGSHHTVWFQSTSGKNFPRFIECQKGELYGDLRMQTPCEFCAAETQTGKKFLPSQKTYAWVIDTKAEVGKRLKWMELPYSLLAQIDQEQFMAQGAPLSSIRMTLMRNVTPAGTRNQTTYTARMVDLVQGVTLEGMAQEHGFATLPPIFGARSMGSAIEQLTTPEAQAEVVQRIHTSNAEFLASRGQQVTTQPSFAQPTQPTFTQQPQPTMQQPVQAPTFTQPTFAQQPQFTPQSTSDVPPFLQQGQANVSTQQQVQPNVQPTNTPPTFEPTPQANYGGAQVDPLPNFGAPQQENAWAQPQATDEWGNPINSLDMESDNITF